MTLISNFVVIYLKFRCTFDSSPLFPVPVMPNHIILFTLQMQLLNYTGATSMSVMFMLVSMNMMQILIITVWSMCCMVMMLLFSINLSVPMLQSVHVVVMMVSSVMMMSSVFLVMNPVMIVLNSVPRGVPVSW